MMWLPTWRNLASLTPYVRGGQRRPPLLHVQQAEVYSETFDDNPSKDPSQLLVLPPLTGMARNLPILTLIVVLVAE